MAKAQKKEIEYDFSPLEDPSYLSTFEDIIATHHACIAHPGVKKEQFVRNLKSCHFDPDWRAGIASFSIESSYPLGAISDATKVKAAHILSCDLPGNTKDVSILGGLFRKENSSPAPAVSHQTWSVLLEKFGSLKDRTPDDITQMERIVFYEGEEDEILITPIPSIKLIHEMNRRLKARREKYYADRKVDAASARRAPGFTQFNVGGSNPQNSGYVVNSYAHRNTARGNVPVFLTIPPQDLRNDAQKVLSILGGSGDYRRIAKVDKASLIAYGRRAAIAIDLASHRNAERRHAIDIAMEFIGAREQVAPMLRDMRPLSKRDPWKSIHKDERAWLAQGGKGEFDENLDEEPDIDTLARRFASEVKRRIEKVMSRGGETPKAFILPDRSSVILREAFTEVLSR